MDRMLFPTRFVTGCAFLLVSLPVFADRIVLVGLKGTQAYVNAQKLADNKNVYAERRIHKAFRKAAELLKSCKSCTVTIKIASGEYTGRAGGGWVFPEAVVPRAKLHILAGYDANFKTRSPFTTPTVLLSDKNRNTAVIIFSGKKHVIREVVISGFSIDVAAGNHYDKQTNSLLKGTSSSSPILSFGYLTTDKLVIADNVFMNAANSVAQPLIRAVSNKAEVIVRNNFFLNNIHTWVVSSASYKFIPKRYLIQGNSFILNWPYNPDSHTGNPGALEIGNKYTARQVEISGNLFAYNVGGAIFPQYGDNGGPHLIIKNNLFFGNGALFSAKSAGDGAFVGKFAGRAVHQIFDADAAADDFDWKINNNSAIDPQLVVPVLKMKAISYDDTPGSSADQSAAGTGNTNADQGGVDVQSEKTPDSQPDDKEVPTEDRSVEDLLADLKSTDDKPKEAKDNFTMDSLASDGNIKNFAPHMPYTPMALPFPHNPHARKYGASEKRIITP